MTVNDTSTARQSESATLVPGGSPAPNLYILGAPKCGTTALAQWLGEHRMIHAPTVKEPHHFSSEYCLTPDRDAYGRNYRNWSDETWAIDASVWQLYSPNAVPNILRERADARFVVMLRNPMQMIPSMHRQQIYNGNELEPDLRKALALSDSRRAGEGARVLPGYPPDHLAYYHSCALGWQIARFMATVDERQRHIILYDDFAASPDRVLRQVYDFIGLEPTMPSGFERVNAAKVRRLPELDRFVKSVGQWKHRQGISVRFGFLSWLRKVNRAEKAVDPLDFDIRASIRARLADDVTQLGDCLGRDLSHWLDAPGGPT
ncbi:Sulfotransferase domain-containing protein [Roseivivax halotolerans]|uniref:Sulfotransferase domain-containing protein n=1 Tax=Roseivivax halotolerans TaxID=93684 RepID=A0A1I6A2A4_9RHOB|nr:sulfotransferase domain-containing protein [Roseivivax halotolerans]SFQ62861.1 Sulfotransferase domain-containing protein [Roseivivax halotolerans]